MDILSDVLRLLRLRASVFLHSSFCGVWTLDSSGTGRATFHSIARGACWLHMPGHEAPVALRGGDLVVFPRDAVHTITSSSKPPYLPPHSGMTQSGQDGPSTSVICGYFDFASPLANPLLKVLPDLIHIRSEDPDNAQWLDMLMRFMSAEASGGAPGSDVLIDKLADVLFIQVIRTHIQRHIGDQGLLAALAEPRISRALEAVHTDPGFAWSVERLAQVAGMSRSAFARRFQEVMAVTPMTYVTHWRMQRAYDRLEMGTESVAAIADTFGYQTEAAFRKSFKQYMGVGPGAVRKGKAGPTDASTQDDST